MAKSEKLTVKELKEKLLADKKNAVLRMSEEELKKCDKFCEHVSRKKAIYFLIFFPDNLPLVIA